MKKNLFYLFCSLIIILQLSACAVGPNYVKPRVVIPAKFKENTQGWKIATPQDERDRGHWWKIFRDPQLNALEAKLNISNQNIAMAVEQYRQALALVDEARANYFPVLTGSASVTTQKQGSSGVSSLNRFQSPTGTSSTSSTTTTPSTTTGTSTSAVGLSTSTSGSNIFTTHSVGITASWEPDIWGGIRRMVEAAKAGAQASRAQLASIRLSAQGSLAQMYFQLRALDTDQKLLDDTVKAYKKSLKLTQNQYAAGTVARTNVIQAQTQLESAQSSAINNGIARAQFEHAIAVLIGKPPALFSMPPRPLTATPPRIPMQIPSVVLERRPDVAQAERLMAQANAQVGVAIYAYYPTLTLQGTANFVGKNLSNWFSLPALSWAVGPQLAGTIYNGGLFAAQVRAACANYYSTVASYRQIVLAAFQDVEDNLVSLRILNKQAVVQNKAAADAQWALRLVMNQYKAGTVDYTAVIVAQVTAFNAQKAADDITGQRMVSAVGLIKALGGGWDSAMLKYAVSDCCGRKEKMFEKRSHAKRPVVKKPIN